MTKASPREKKLLQIPASNGHWVKRCARLSSHSLAYLNVVAKFIWGHLLSDASHPITVKGWVMIAGSDPRWNRGGFHKAPACWYYREEKRWLSGRLHCMWHQLAGFKKKKQKRISSYKRLLSHLHARTHWLWKSVFKITIWLTARAKVLAPLSFFLLFCFVLWH